MRAPHARSHACAVCDGAMVRALSLCMQCWLLRLPAYLQFVFLQLFSRSHRPADIHGKISSADLLLSYIKSDTVNMVLQQVGILLGAFEGAAAAVCVRSRHNRRHATSSSAWQHCAFGLASNVLFWLPDTCVPGYDARTITAQATASHWLPPTGSAASAPAASPSCSAACSAWPCSCSPRSRVCPALRTTAWCGRPPSSSACPWCERGACLHASMLVCRLLALRRCPCHQCMQPLLRAACLLALGVHHGRHVARDNLSA